MPWLVKFDNQFDSPRLFYFDTKEDADVFYQQKVDECNALVKKYGRGNAWVNGYSPEDWYAPIFRQ